MDFRRLSIIVPCFNEESGIRSILQRINAAPCALEKQIVIVDDGSSDNSAREAEAYRAENPQFDIQLLRHEKNKGKGASIRTAIPHCTGELIVIQDADLEYAPEEYGKLLQPVLEGRADVVYGSRFRGHEAHRALFFWHSVGNKWLTFLSNLFTGLNLTDMETCYKLFRADMLKQLRLRENRFGFEPEVTARISKVKGIRVYEVGISYFGRTYAEGKKITWRDGFRALYCIIRYNLFARK